MDWSLSTKRRIVEIDVTLASKKPGELGVELCVYQSTYRLAKKLFPAFVSTCTHKRGYALCSNTSRLPQYRSQLVLEHEIHTRSRKKYLMFWWLHIMKNRTLLAGARVVQGRDNGLQCTRARMLPVVYEMRRSDEWKVLLRRRYTSITRAPN